MSDLASRECVPCRKGTPPLDPTTRTSLLALLGEGWSVVDGHHLHKRYAFPNFADALAFVNRVGAVAEQANHHPDFALGWGRVELTIWTHTIDELSEADFVLAARADRVLG